ncbi:hypothetical protein DPMN_050715 [Dreissena polymorpha]|uniref:Uncharacterized protein n=1 Tax=Dreissena polymorpha TaxID=45954 RepID=A0A9D4HPK4_DREPO|nr:hypothetical protein DPMN_050715 [Dreissena polymorpha]
MTNHKTSPEQSSIFQIVREINKTKRKLPHPPGGHFHVDWANNVTSRVKLPPPSGSNFIQLTGTIFKLNSCIKETNVLTEFQENWTKNVTSRVFTCFHYIHIEKNAPPTGGHVFPPILTIFNLAEISIKPMKTAPPTGGHVFQLTGTTFELNQHIIKANTLINFELDRDIIGTNLLTKFHEDRTINVAKSVYEQMWTDRQRTKTGHKSSLEQSDTYKTNLFTKFHDDWANNVTSRKKLPPPGSHETNVLTKFHENWAKNVTSRVFTFIIRKPPGGRTDRQTDRPTCAKQYTPSSSKGGIKNTPPTNGHVFLLIWTIFKLVRAINKINVFTNFHDDWANLKTAPPTGGHVFERTKTTFELNQHIIKANILTKFHENWAKNVTSGVFTCFHYIHLEKNAPPTGGHVFSPIWTIFKLVRDINITNVLTNFHDDWTKIVTYRPFRKTAPPTGGHVFQRTENTFELNQHIIKANILTNFELDRDFIGTNNLLTKFHEDRTINVAS